MKHKENHLFIELDSAKTIISEAEKILYKLANEIKNGDNKYKVVYDNLLYYFGKADLNNNYTGQLKEIILTFKREVLNETH